MWVLLVWVAAHSEYPLPSQLPEIQFRSQDELRRMYVCEEFNRCDEANYHDESLKIATLYKSKTQTMFFNEDFDILNPSNKAAALHELVHYGQQLAGKFGSVCKGMLEKEAYGLADEWLIENGFPPPKEKSVSRSLAETCWEQDS